MQAAPEVAQEVVREQVGKLLGGASLHEYNQRWTSEHADHSLRHRVSAAEMQAVLDPSQQAAAADTLLQAPDAALEGSSGSHKGLSSLPALLQASMEPSSA